MTTETAATLEAFPTREAMERAYATRLQVHNGYEPWAANFMAQGKAVYVPHLYRGGWVIRGFWYSVERVGVYVPADSAGNPAAV